MKTANDFARAAHAIGQLAVQMKPEDSDPNAQARKLIQYHLQTAATKTRELAEALGQRETA